MGDSPQLSCPHLCSGKHDGGEPLRAKARPHRACHHLVGPALLEVTLRFHPDDGSHDVLCNSCLEVEGAHLYEVCQACWRAMLSEHDWDDNLGGMAEFAIDTPAVPIEEVLSVDAPPDEMYVRIMLTSRQRAQLGIASLAISSSFELWAGSSVGWTRWGGMPELTALDMREDRSEVPTLSLKLSSCGQHLLVAWEFESPAVLYHLTNEAVCTHIYTFSRGDYHTAHARYAAEFVERDGQSLLVCASNWNRLDVYMANTGDLITDRETEKDDDDDDKEYEHSIDYFFCALYPSRDGRWLVNTGWCWHPVAVVNVWSLDRWLDENPYESEDGPSLLTPHELVTDDWDKPLVWLDGSMFVAWGIGNRSEAHLPGLTVMDADGGVLNDLIGIARQDCTELAWTGQHITIRRDNGDVTCVDLELGAITHELSGHEVLTHLEGDQFVTGQPHGAQRIVRFFGV